MRTIDRIHRSGVGITPERTIGDAAEIMEQAGVGCLAVMEGDQVVGIVTDRDLVRRGMARRLPLDARVDAVMSSPVLTIDAGADVRDAYVIFRTHAVRRLAVTADGAFVGILAIDDLLVDLADDLSSLVRPVMAELLFAHHDSPTPITI